MTTPWHMARVASRRQLPKPRKMMGPVGEQPNIDWGGCTVDLTHICCGMIVCKCDPYAFYRRTMAENPGCKPAVHAYLKKGNKYVAPRALIYFSAIDLPPDVLEELETKQKPRLTPGQLMLERPGSVDVAGLEKLRAERFTEYHLRKAAEREF